MNFHRPIEKIFTFNEISIYFGLFLVTFVLYRLFNKTKSKKYKLPPGPTGLPLVGYLPFLGSKPHQTLHELSKKYGNVFRLYLGRSLVVVCNDWPSTEEAFSKMETTSRPSGLFDALPNGFGLGTVNGKEWIELRSFTVKTMKEVGLGQPQWEELLQEEVDEMVKEIREHRGQPLDICKKFATTFTNNIMTLLFGHRLPTGHSATAFIGHSVDYVSETFVTLSSAIFLPRFCHFLNKIGLYGSKTTREKLLAYSKFVKNHADEELEKGGKDAFIGIYNREVEQQKSYPKAYVTKRSYYGSVQGLIFAAGETTKTALVWLLVAVTQHPDVQAKIQKELDSVLGKDGKIMWSEHAKIPYTFAAIMESMRWETVVPVNPLRVTDGDIKVQGYDVPKGTYISLNLWALHNDPKYWPEPHKFKPERFLLDAGQQINSNPQSYAPFSFGRRNCPGKLIALMEIFLYFVTIMRNFTLQPLEDGHLKYDTHLGVTFHARNLKVRFIPRDEVTTNY